MSFRSVARRDDRRGHEEDTPELRVRLVLERQVPVVEDARHEERRAEGPLRHRSRAAAAARRAASQPRTSVATISTARMAHMFSPVSAMHSAWTA